MAGTFESIPFLERARYRAAPALALAAVLLAFPSPSLGDEKRDNGLDVLSYDLRLNVDDEAGTILGEARIRCRLVDPDPKEALFDLVGLEVRRVERDGRAVSWRRTPDHLLAVALGPNAIEGGETAFTVAYGGKPERGLAFAPGGGGRTYVLADNWPEEARGWFPCVDHPSDKALVSFAVEVRPDWTVAAAGTPAGMEIRDDGRRVFRFAGSVPIQTYCMVFAAGEYEKIPSPKDPGFEIAYFLYPEDLEAGKAKLAEVTPSCIAFFTELIGPYPFRKCHLVQCPTRFGGMENAGTIFLRDGRFAYPEDMDGLVAHEMAHQWFGDHAGIREWNHIWLSEGFATYMEHLYTAHTRGEEAFQELLLDDARRIRRATRDGPRPVVGDAGENPNTLLTTFSYQKGAFVLHMLRKLVGEEAFFASLKDYYETYSGGIADTDDFRRIVEKRAGLGLEWFFDQWLEGAALPRLEASWTYDEDARTARLTLRQEEPFFRLRLVAAALDAKGGFSGQKVFWIRDQEAVAEFAMDAKPPTLVLDPEEEVLKNLVFGKSLEEWLLQARLAGDWRVRHRALEALRASGNLEMERRAADLLAAPENTRIRELLEGR